MSSGAPTPNMRGAGNSGDQLVQFRMSDAERIANVVNIVEGSRRIRKGSVLPRAAGGGGGVVLCTFTAPWAKDGTAVVTSVSSTASQYTATNHFASLAGTGSKKCAIGLDATGWILIAAEC